MSINKLSLEPREWREGKITLRALNENEQMPRESSIWCNCCVYIRNTFEFLNFGNVQSLEHHFIEGREKGRPRAVCKIPTFFNTFFSLAPEIATTALKQPRIGGLFEGGWGTNVVTVIAGEKNPLTCPIDKHSQFRRFFNERFSFNRVEKHGPFLIESTEKMFENWLSRGEEFDLSASLRQFTIESICKYIGLKTPHNIQENFDVMVNQSSKKGLKQTNFLLGLLLAVEEEKLAEAVEAVRGTVIEAYAESQEEEHGFSSGVEERTILQEMATALNRDKEVIFSEEEIFDTVRVFLLGGQDTTTSLLLTLVYYLSQNSEWCEKIREELESSTETDQVKRIYSCQTINMVIAECLRLVPPTPIVGREGAVRDLVIEKPGLEPIYVPKGSTIQVDNLFSSKDTERWGADAEAFNPARQAPYYNAEKHKVETPFPNCTFGGPGRHHCIGEELALLVAAIFTAKLVYYDIEITSKKIKTKNSLANSFQSEDHPHGHLYATIQARGLADSRREKEKQD